MLSVAGMTPERVMYSSESYSFLVAFNGSVHHMSWVQRVDKVGRKRWVLLLLVYLLFVKRVDDAEVLDDGLDLVNTSDSFVGLDAWKTKSSDPLDWISSVGNHLCTLGKPLLNVVRVSEHVSNTLNSHFCKITWCSVKSSICLEQFSVLELPLNLFPCPNKGNSVNWCHHCLLYRLPVNTSFQNFDYVFILGIFIFFKVCFDES